tara:strand:- start:798 stop:902 length:105 start_codon:yes stop_codon:yes gene_type:complete
MYNTKEMKMVKALQDEENEGFEDLFDLDEEPDPD